MSNLKEKAGLVAKSLLDRVTTFTVTEVVELHNLLNQLSKEDEKPQIKAVPDEEAK